MFTSTRVMVMKTDTEESLDKVGLKRDTTDKFYTKPEVVSQCMAEVKRILSVRRHDLIVEPSAGNGSFIPFIKSMTDHHVFYDLYPQHADIQRANFLKLNNEEIRRNGKPRHRTIHFVGNPPFGRQSSLAKKFILKSTEIASSISFILPRSFRKQSLQSVFPLCFHLEFDMDIPPNAFIVDGNEHDVPCVFQIWRRRSRHRCPPPVILPQHFRFVKKNDDPHISIQRVGGNAGLVSKDFHHKNVSSHYFLRFTNNLSVDENIERLASVHYTFNNTVGPKSLSKPEVIKALNDVFNQDEYCSQVS